MISLPIQKRSRRFVVVHTRLLIVHTDGTQTRNTWWSVEPHLEPIFLVFLYWLVRVEKDKLDDYIYVLHPHK